MSKGLQNADVGDIYQKEDGSVYRVVGYQPNPTVILERLAGPDAAGQGIDGDTETHAIGCLNAQAFTRLVRG